MSAQLQSNFDVIAETPFLRRVHEARQVGRCYYCDHMLDDCRCAEDFARRQAELVRVPQQQAGLYAQEAAA